MKNIKYIISTVFICSFLFSTVNVKSQVGNEWINYDQEYFKIHVSEDGIYRISYAELLAAGIPVHTTDPRKIQIYHNGGEQYIYIHGENSSGIFDPNGYIEFYGRRNRGELDLEFYDNPNNQVNPDYSFYTDTSAYFLTWNNSTSNRRMTIQNSTDFSPYIPYAQDHCMKNIRTNYTGEYHQASSQCLFTEGEGWFDNNVINTGINVRKSISVPNVYNQSGNAIIKFAVAGVPASETVSYIQHSINVSFLGQNVQRRYQGYQFITEMHDISSNRLTNPLIFDFSTVPIEGNISPDRNAVAYIDIKYPYSWNFPSNNYDEFYLPYNSRTTKDYVEISGFNQSSNIILYDITNHERINPQVASSRIKALVNYSNSERFMILINENGYKSVNRISKINTDNKFINYISENPNANYIIITSNKLLSSSREYAFYRQSTGYNTIVVSVEQLYDQFAYGINKHPVSIKNYNKKLYEINENLERMMFVIGKSTHNTFFRKSVSAYNICQVPSAGFPSSDNLLTIGVAESFLAPQVGTGRLSASTNDEVISYLNKVRIYENNEPAEWMKNIIHFGGGATYNEQSQFAAYLNNYENIIQDTLFGGSVKTFLKRSSDPIEITQSDSVESLINNGVTMMTFFGHGSSSGFDQNIDFPENYNNLDKYPFILANSCFTGDIHNTSSVSISEQWVNISGKGAIGFLANVARGFGSLLNVFSNEFYRNIAYKKYMQPVSLQIKNSLEAIEISYRNNISMQVTCHQFTLNGDPAVVLNSQEKPDLVITPAAISFIPNNITTVLDSFDVKIVLKNLGKATADTFLVNIERTFQNGIFAEKNVVVFGCNYSDTLLVRFPVDRLNGPGLNTIKVLVDINNEVDESDETNNEAIINFFIKTDDLYPIYPYKYAIYPDNSVNLIASTGDPFVDNLDYKIQIDTTDSYNSPLLREDVVFSDGGMVEWRVPYNLTENRVYYWRVARNHSISDSIVWNESSFIYEKDQEGWSQAHHYQFKEDSYQFINYNRRPQNFTFVDVPKRLNVHNEGNVWTGVEMIIGWNIDGSTNNGLGDVSNCGSASSVLVAVIDPVDLLGWASDKFDYGHVNYPMCSSSTRPQYYFSFPAETTGPAINIQGIRNMANLINSVPDGYYIVVYSWKNAYFESWPEDVVQLFENLGSTLIRNISNSIPYIFFTKKGTPTSTQEIKGNSTADVIDLSVELATDFSYGRIKSVDVGPAMEWQSLHWYQEAMEDPSDDEVILNVYGITAQNNEELLIGNIVPDNYDIFSLDESIDYLTYPKLRLDFYTKDETNKTPAQLKKWQVKFKGVPETVIDPKLGFSFCCDTINEGGELKFAVATKNITKLDMDSLVVKYWIQDKDNRKIEIDKRTLRPHPGGDIIIDTVNYSTLNLAGLNSIWVEYNPINEATNDYYQREQYHFNNIAVKYFFVQRDITNPLLDVSFDGRYIMNGEIVSSKPEIRIKLKDENKFLLLNDTSLFKMFITDPDPTRSNSDYVNEERRIYFGSLRNEEETIDFIPAVSSNNSCEIIYRPVFTEDGTYRLRVRAEDVSGNISGINDYIITFEVINKSTITHLLNYPNPFSTSTRFVFELTGSEVPDDLRIEIFTVTGKLVKVIYVDELGPIRIGRNITEYAWDGKDMYGDRLANGVYFYQVKARINGEDIERRATSADKYFKKEIGKMYMIK